MNFQPLRFVIDLISDAAATCSPQEMPAIFLDRDERAILGTRVTSPRALRDFDVIFICARPSVAPGGLIRALIGLGDSYEVQSEAEHAVVMSHLCSRVSAEAVLINPVDTSTSSVQIDNDSRSRLPVFVAQSMIYSNFHVANIMLPLNSPSAPGTSVELTVALSAIPLFCSDVAVVKGHLHSSACNHARENQGNAFRAAFGGNFRSLQRALQPTGWNLWLPWARGSSTEEMADTVSGFARGSTLTLVEPTAISAISHTCTRAHGRHFLGLLLPAETLASSVFSLTLAPMLMHMTRSVVEARNVSLQDERPLSAPPRTEERP